MAKPVRLLVVGVAWPTETFLERLLRGLAGEGMHITLASEKRPEQAWLEETGIQWFSAPVWRGPSLISFRHLIVSSLRAMLVARKDARVLWRSIAAFQDWRTNLVNWYVLAPFAGRRWDAIYFPWNFSAVSYLPLFDLDMPVVLSCRGSQIHVAPTNPRRAHLLPGLQQTFMRAAKVHCVSQNILEKAKALGLDPAKAQVIHPAVDADFFQPPENPRVPDGMFRIVTTGSLIWVKGLEYALLAVRQLKDEGIPVCFEIIGDGSEHSRVLFTIHDLALQDCVHLAGRLPPDQVRARLQQSDVFVLSSLSEGISNAALEAMACGLPVVTSDCGGMKEAVTDGAEGFLTPVRNSKALAAKLLLLADSPNLRLQIGQAGRERIREDFELNDQLCQWMDVFNNAVNHP